MIRSSYLPLGYDPTKLNPEAIAWMAAFISIPVDAEHVGS